MNEYMDDKIGVIEEEKEEPEQGGGNQLVLEAAVQQFTDRLATSP